jgi:hypothetical protein
MPHRSDKVLAPVKLKRIGVAEQLEAQKNA